MGAYVPQLSGSRGELSQVTEVVVDCVSREHPWFKINPSRWTGGVLEWFWTGGGVGIPGVPHRDC